MNRSYVSNDSFTRQVLKCAAVAHTRSALRTSMRTALRAWSTCTLTATTASVHARLIVEARVRLRCASVLRLWRLWAHGARGARKSACVVAVVCSRRLPFLRLRREFVWLLSCLCASC